MELLFLVGKLAKTGNHSLDFPSIVEAEENHLRNLLGLHLQHFEAMPNADQLFLCLLDIDSRESDIMRGYLQRVKLRINTFYLFMYDIDIILLNDVLNLHDPVLKRSYRRRAIHLKDVDLDQLLQVIDRFLIPRHYLQILQETLLDGSFLLAEYLLGGGELDKRQIHLVLA